MDIDKPRRHSQAAAINSLAIRGTYVSPNRGNPLPIQQNILDLRLNAASIKNHPLGKQNHSSSLLDRIAR
jgi:hypothetical protein